MPPFSKAVHDFHGRAKTDPKVVPIFEAVSLGLCCCEDWCDGSATRIHDQTVNLNLSVPGAPIDDAVVYSEVYEAPTGWKGVQSV